MLGTHRDLRSRRKYQSQTPTIGKITGTRDSIFEFRVHEAHYRSYGERSSPATVVTRRACSGPASQAEAVALLASPSRTAAATRSMSTRHPTRFTGVSEYAPPLSPPPPQLTESKKEAGGPEGATLGHRTRRCVSIPGDAKKSPCVVHAI